MIFFDISISSVFEIYKDDAHSVNKTCEIRQTARNKIKSRVRVKSYVHKDFCLCFSREGRNQYDKAFGVDAKDLFQALYRFVENTPTHTHLYSLCVSSS